MASHYDVAQAFLRGRRLKGNSMYSEGNTIFSWGSHFPVATRLKDGSYLLNTDDYSSSTSRHQSIVASALSGKEVYRCSTGEIQDAICYPDKPVIIQKLKNPKDINEALDLLRDVSKEAGLKRFPKSWFYNRIMNKIVLERI